MNNFEANSQISIENQIKKQKVSSLVNAVLQ